MRKTAERVEAQMEHTWPVAERLLVAVSSGPRAERLVQAARRLAERLRVEWLAVYVETPAEVRLPQADRDRMWQTLRLAESLGAETAVLTGDRPAEEIVKYARRRNVSTIVVGKPAHPRWKDFVFGSVRRQLERVSGDIDVYVVSGEEEEGGFSAPRALRRPASPARAYLWGLAVVAACTGASALLFRRVELVTVVMIGVMLATGLIISTLTARQRRQRAAKRRRQKAAGVSPG